MYSNKEHREKLKQDAKNILFEDQFQREVERQIADKQSKAGRSLAEQLGETKDAPVRTQPRFAIKNDDEHGTLMWRSLMKDCAYYYDVPTIEEEVEMKKSLQRKYDGLFAANWRPALQTRRDLVTWACG